MGEETKLPIIQDTASVSSEEVPITQWVRNANSASNGRRDDDVASSSSQVEPIARRTRLATSSSSSSSQQPPQAASSSSLRPPPAQLHASRKQAKEEKEIELFGRKATTIVDVEERLKTFSHLRAQEELKAKWIASMERMLGNSRNTERWRLEYGHIFDSVYREVETNNRHLLLLTDSDNNSSPPLPEDEDVTMSTEEDAPSSRKRKGRTVSTVSLNQRPKLAISPMSDGQMTLMLQADLCTLSLAEFRRKYGFMDLGRWATFSAFGDDGPLPFDPDYAKKVAMLVDTEKGETAYRATDADIVHALAMCDPEAFKTLLDKQNTRMSFYTRTMTVWKLFYSANHLPISKFRHTAEQQSGLVDIIEEIWHRSDLIQRAEVKEFEAKVAIEEAKAPEQRVSFNLNVVGLLDDYAILLAYFCRADACLLVMTHLWNQLSQRQQILFLIYGPLYAGYNRKLTIKAKDRGILTYDIREWGKWFKTKWTQAEGASSFTDSDHYLFLSFILPQDVVMDPTIWLNRVVLGPILKHVAANRGMGRKSATFKRFMTMKLTGRAPSIIKSAPYSKSDFWAAVGASPEDQAMVDCLRQISRGNLAQQSHAPFAKMSKAQLRQQPPEMMLEKEVFQNPLFGTLYFDPRTVDPRVRDQLNDYPGTIPINPSTITEYWKEKFQNLCVRTYVGMDKRSANVFNVNARHLLASSVSIPAAYTIPAPVSFQYWCDTMKSSFSSLLYMLENPGSHSTEEEDLPAAEDQVQDFWEEVGDQLIVPKIFKFYGLRAGELRSTINPLPATIHRDIDDTLDEKGESGIVEAEEWEHVAFTSRGREYFLSAAERAEEAQYQHQEGPANGNQVNGYDLYESEPAAANDTRFSLDDAD